MNSFGRIFRVSIYGESHGPEVGILIDGCPAGIELVPEDFSDDLLRRRGGMHKGATPRAEADVPELVSGTFKGRTTGAPLLIRFTNSDTRSSDYDKQRDIPRPGHADFVAAVKAGGHEDYRGGGHYSGRLTVALVAAGVVAKKMLTLVKESSIRCEARILEIGGHEDIEVGLESALRKGDSIGGLVECCVHGLPIAIGEPFFDSIESLISHIIFAIPAVRGIEFGTGFAAARMYGSEHNDRLLNESGKTDTNHAGGVAGGLTNGNPLLFRVAIKPTSSTPMQQESYSRESGKLEAFTVSGRHDLCIALRVPVVVECAVAIVLADLMRHSGHIPAVAIS
jgi:chorismate synthase